MSLLTEQWATTHIILKRINVSKPRTIEEIKELMRMKTLDSAKVIDLMLELRYITMSKESLVPLKEVRRALEDMFQKEEIPPEIYHLNRGFIERAHARAKSQQ
jgi:hypothetical protein